MSKSERPKADNRRVLMAYSERMKQLLAEQKYNAGKRPSGHVISTSGFLKNRGGAISASVLELNNANGSGMPESLLKFAATTVDAAYNAYCVKKGLEIHPARMQSNLAAFFVQLLTEKNDLVFDPFAGSNTTGAVAEKLGRRWLSVEVNIEYARGSRGRFK
jgi:site-specific DNA-methyltransferase (cytosine-N4-specific)